MDQEALSPVYPTVLTSVLIGYLAGCEPRLSIQVTDSLGN